MSSLTLMRALFPTVATPGAGTGGDNLLSPDPKESWQFTGSTGVDLDLGAAATINQVFAGFISPNATSAELLSATAMGGPYTSLGAMQLGPASSRRRHAFIKTADVTSRYWRINLLGAGANFMGIAAFGSLIQPLWGHEWGSGRQPQDMSVITPLIGGGFGIQRGARMASWRFTCGDLTDAEIAALYLMAEEVGISAPVVVVEDPDYTSGLNERIHYGLFDRPEAYEREVPGASRWSFQVREWV